MGKIKYSIVQRTVNLAEQALAKQNGTEDSFVPQVKFYGAAQQTDCLTLDQFAKHISEHHSKYGKGDIYCVLVEMVSCMREQLLLGNRDVKYQQSNVAPYVLRLKEDMQTSILISGILFVLSLVLGCVFTIFMDLRRDRGIRMIAISELVGTAFAGILTVLLLWLNPAKHLFIEPDYLYLFFKNHVDWMIRVLSVITVFGLVFGMSLIGIYFSRRKEKGD